MEVTDETSECPRFGCFLCKLKHESWLLLSVAVRWFWSCGRDRTERPKLDEAWLCLYSLSKALTTTRSSAHPPRHTRSWIPAQTLTQLYRCLAQHSHPILLRKKVYAEKCLFDRHWVYSVKAYIRIFLHICSPLNWCAFKNFLNFKITNNIITNIINGNHLFFSPRIFQWVLCFVTCLTQVLLPLCVCLSPLHTVSCTLVCPTVVQERLHYCASTFQ